MHILSGHSLKFRLAFLVKASVALLFLAMVSLFSACENDMAKVQQFAEKDLAAQETGKDVEIVYSDSGVIKARILAPEVIKKDNEKGITEFPKGLRLYIYNDSLRVESKLSANYGIADDQKEELLVRDNVVVVNIEGKKLNSEELIWRRRDKKVYSDKFVKITTKDQIIYGNGFESDESFTNYVITHVTGTIIKQNDEFSTDD